MEFLHLLPVITRHIHRYLQLCGCIFYNLVDVLVDCVNLAADGILSSTEHSFFALRSVIIKSINYEIEEANAFMICFLKIID